MIRIKAADALLQAPSRIIPRSVDGVIKDTETDEDNGGGLGINFEKVVELAAEADTRDVGLEDLDDIEELLW